MRKLVSEVLVHWPLLFFPVGWYISSYVERWHDEQLTQFRNKSALFSRELKPGEEYTWK